MDENKTEEVKVEQTETKKTFDDVLSDKEYQAEFDRRISKAKRVRVQRRLVQPLQHQVR